MLSLIENKRPIDKKNDYYRLQGLLDDHLNKEVSSNDDYEMVRVARKRKTSQCGNNAEITSTNCTFFRLQGLL